MDMAELKMQSGSCNVIFIDTFSLIYIDEIKKI